MVKERTIVVNENPVNKVRSDARGEGSETTSLKYLYKTLNPNETEMSLNRMDTKTFPLPMIGDNNFAIKAFTKCIKLKNG